ncbi:toxin YoeB [Mucilaginibacter gracilis]|uniref:Putative mRNA interferase YoeB n=1 Tax=Mucilaginibacter gracilis TaxID=423350 RepID=A0A495J8R1_9SPHI|nr:Txe/YoeB family addiction module toxin [Mucilaginibacter gracilis]RKR85277.1 toxin YoeB [Mucilaginibacter gracilis]
MEIEFTVKAEHDLMYWKKVGDKVVLKKIRILLESILETPFKGIGKPEALKYDLAGKWSRRITKADRIIYQVINNTIYIYSVRGHYE